MSCRCHTSGPERLHRDGTKSGYGPLPLLGKGSRVFAGEMVLFPDSVAPYFTGDDVFGGFVLLKHRDVAPDVVPRREVWDRLAAFF